VVALALWVFLLAGQRSGSVDVFSLRSEVKRVLRASLSAWCCSPADDFLLRLQFISRPFLLLSALTNALLLAGARIVERRTRGGAACSRRERMVVIVGCGEQAVQMAQVVVTTGVGAVAARAGRRGRLRAHEVEGFPVVCAVEACRSTCAARSSTTSCWPCRRASSASFEGTLLRCHELGVRVRLALRPFPHVQPRMRWRTSTAFRSSPSRRRPPRRRGCSASA